MSFHYFSINEVYSDNTGRVQYIEFVGHTLNGQDEWAGHQLLSTNGVNDNTYDFLTDLPSNTTIGKSVLVATQGYADLGLAVPDYIIPEEGFLFQPGGEVIFADMDEIAYESLPNDGITAINGAGAEVVNSPKNFDGVLGKIPGTPILGGEFTDTLSGSAGKDFMVGLGGNDVLNGGGGNDTIKGGDGGDKINGSGGSDRLQGDAGNDTLTGTSVDIFNGGTGLLDTLKLASGALDLTDLANSRTVGIEQIDLRGAGGLLTLAKADVLALSTSVDTLKVFGTADDTINVVGSFTVGSTSGSGFTTYSLGGGAKLLVHEDVNVM